MGNHKLEHHWSQVNIVSPIMLEIVVVEILRKHVGVRVIQSLDAGITITWMEMVVTPNMDFVRRGILLEFVVKLGNGSNGILARRNLSWSLTLVVITIEVVWTPQMVFINPIMITHVNRTTDWPLVNSMVDEGYKSVNVMNPKGGYW